MYCRSGIGSNSTNSSANNNRNIFGTVFFLCPRPTLSDSLGFPYAAIESPGCAAFGSQRKRSRFLSNMNSVLILLYLRVSTDGVHPRLQ